jgi:GTP-binding protein
MRLVRFIFFILVNLISVTNILMLSGFSNLRSRSVGHHRWVRRFCTTNITPPLLPQLFGSDTMEKFALDMKSFQKESASNKVVSYCQERADKNELSPSMVWIAFKTLKALKRFDLFPHLLPSWQTAVEMQHQFGEEVDVQVVKGVMKSFVTIKRLDAAEEVANSVGVFINEKNYSSITESTSKHATDTKIALLPELAFGLVSGGLPYKALKVLDIMHSRSLEVDVNMSKRILQQFLVHSTNLESIRKAIRVLSEMNGLSDHDSFQMVTNTFIRNVTFMKGAVSMDTLPVSDCPEVCFIGRSNVGKSSLINFICNRKNLAFTSNTPGKTSEFNYFEAQGVVGAAKESHRFYLVDLPGVGFARKNKDLRKSWTDLLHSYTHERSTLKAVFHLVDSRHGLLDADEECLNLLSTLPDHVQYVIVLTKVDKHGKKIPSSVGESIDRIYSEISKRTSKVVPIIVTSSSTRAGGVQLFSQLIDSIAASSETV